MGDMAEVYDYDYDPSDFDDPPEVTCKFCGKQGLSWDEYRGRWVLINKAGNPHQCSPAALRARVLDDFDVV